MFADGAESAIKIGPMTVVAHRSALTTSTCLKVEMANLRICSAADRGKPANVVPDVRRKPPNGTVRKWLDAVAVPHSSDECLVFPFSRQASGHGRISERLGASTAHVYVAQKVLGPKPSPAHECCHDCGNGDQGCVNPRHLYWGTRAENMKDRVRHGVMVNPPKHLGEANVNAAITEKQARAIIAMLDAGKKAREIASIIGCSTGVVYGIKYRTTWTWVRTQEAINGP